MSHGTRVNKSGHTYEWGRTHVWICLVTYPNEARHTFEDVTARLQIRHVTHTNESSHIYNHVGATMNQSREGLLCSVVGKWVTYDIYVYVYIYTHTHTRINRWAPRWIWRGKGYCVRLWGNESHIMYMCMYICTYINTTHTHTWTGGGHDEYGAWRAAVFGCGRGTVRGCFEHHVRCVVAVNPSRVAWMGMLYIETYKYMCAYVHVYVYTHTYRQTYVSLPSTTSVWSKWVCYTSIYVNMFAYVYVFVYIHLCRCCEPLPSGLNVSNIYMYEYVCIYVCICVYTQVHYLRTLPYESNHSYVVLI